MIETIPAQGGAIQKARYETRFGSLASFEKGGVELIADDPRHYVFSNIFEVASKMPAWDRVAVGKNWEYVMEAVRAEGTSPWFTAAHDEFVICMDDAGTEVLVELVKLESPVAEPGSEGAVLVGGEPTGPRMGRIHLKRGHQALLPAGSAYRLTKPGDPGVLLLQTIEGPLTQYRWAEICQTV
jgi:hypothetical protein